MAGESFDAGAGFTVDLALKDVRYMRQLAESSRCPLRTAGEHATGHTRASALQFVCCMPVAVVHGDSIDLRHRLSSQQCCALFPGQVRE